MADDFAKAARAHIDVPWDELRAARVHKRALEAFRNGTDIDDEIEDGAELLPLDADELAPNEREQVGSSDDVGDSDSAPDPTDDPDEEDVRELASALPSKEWRRSRLGRARWWLLAATLMAASVILWLAVPRPGSEVQPAGWEVASTLRFADGSRSLLGRGAQVEVVRDSQPAVQVKQASGRVRYEVVPRKQRRFVVAAHGVEVTVLGTVFEVAVSERRVAVQVQRGKVRVRQGARLVELAAGEHITMHARGGHASAHPFASAHAVAAASSAPKAAAAKHAPEARAAAETGSGGATVDSGQGGARAARSAEVLMRKADSARASGNLGEAAKVLRELVRRHPRDRRVTLALFTLGKVERQRGRHLEAAQAFEGCGHALRGDALAAAASSWQAAGQPARARAAATRYLQRFPDGVHASSMHAIAP